MESGTTRFKIKLGDIVEAYFLGDAHEGSANVDYAALKTAVQQIKDSPHPKVVFLMGDLIEAIMPDDKRWEPSSVYEQYRLRDLKNLPFKQADNICDILEPIREFVVAILIGNHEEVYIKKHFGDVYDYIAKKFPNAKKLGGCGFYRIVLEMAGVNARCFDIALKHGTSVGGKLMGYPINKVRESFEFELADFCIMGHGHRLEAKRVRYRELNHTGDNVNEKKMWYGMSGTFRRTYVMGHGDWYEQKGREEADVGYLRATMAVTRPHTAATGPRPYLFHTKLERMFLD
jgi:UDP-2,3-diacylglucosamine pyrophosphatase LpxH